MNHAAAIPPAPNIVAVVGNSQQVLGQFLAVWQIAPPIRLGGGVSFQLAVSWRNQFGKQDAYPTFLFGNRTPSSTLTAHGVPSGASLVDQWEGF